MTQFEALSWLRQQADSRGECDRCHCEGELLALPIEIESEPDAHWQYCAKCFRRLVTIYRRRPRE